jgi:hypothetical protein
MSEKLEKVNDDWKLSFFKINDKSEVKFNKRNNLSNVCGLKGLSADMS